MKRISRQRRWQEKRRSEGRCVTCGYKNGDGKARCERCRGKQSWGYLRRKLKRQESG